MARHKLLLNYLVLRITLNVVNPLWRRKVVSTIQRSGPRELQLDARSRGQVLLLAHPKVSQSISLEWGYEDYVFFSPAIYVGRRACRSTQLIRKVKLLYSENEKHHKAIRELEL